MNKKGQTEAKDNLKQAFQDYFAFGLSFNLGIKSNQIQNYTCEDCEGNYSDCCLKETQITLSTMEDLENALASFDPSHGNAFIDFDELFNSD